MSITSTRARPRIVGIAGGSASGKTTFAAALTTHLEVGTPPLRVETFHMDRYARADRSAGPFFVSSVTGETLFNINHPDAFETARLVEEIEARVGSADAPDVLIVEGLLVLRDPALRACLDLRLFLELDADERALRRLLRDMAGARGSRDPAVIAAYYRESARVGHALYVEPSRVYADLILRGDGELPRMAGMTASVLRDC